MNMPEDQASDAVQETPELQGDPMKDIIAQEARNLAAEFGTVLEEDEETDEQVSETADESEEQKPAEKTPGKRPAGDTSEKRLGTDEVLKVLDADESRNAKEAARIIRSMQGTVGRTQTAWKRQQEEFRELARQVADIQRSRTQPTDGEPDPDDPLSQLPQEQIELFQRLADRLGYVKQDAIDGQETEKNTISFKQESAKNGMEKWGDRFGHVDGSGQFHFADDTSEKVAAVYERFYDPRRGVTPEDLFVLGTLDDLLKEAEDRGRKTASDEMEKSRRSGQERVKMVKRGLTETGSTGGKTAEVIYRGFGKDNPDDVIARAWRAALRELPKT